MINAMPPDKLFVKRGDKVVGPYSISQIRQALLAAQLASSDLFAGTDSGPWQSFAHFENTGDADGPLTDDDIRLFVSAAKATPGSPKKERSTPSLLGEVWTQLIDKWESRQQGSRDQRAESRRSPIAAILLLGLVLLLVALAVDPVSEWFRAAAQQKLATDSARPTDQKQRRPIFQSGGPAGADPKISDRFKRKFQDLYDRVKGDLAKFKKVPRRQMPEFASELLAQEALLPPQNDIALNQIAQKLRGAAKNLANAAQLFVTQGQAELELETGGGPLDVGGMSQETRQMFEKVRDGTQKQILLNLESAKKALEELEKERLFDKLME